MHELELISFTDICISFVRIVCIFCINHRTKCDHCLECVFESWKKINVNNDRTLALFFQLYNVIHSLWHPKVILCAFISIFFRCYLSTTTFAYYFPLFHYFILWYKMENFLKKNFFHLFSSYHFMLMELFCYFFFGIYAHSLTGN